MRSRSKATRQADGGSAEAAHPAMRSVRSTPSIFSADAVLVGNIDQGGEIQMDGTLEGDVRCASLAVGQNATVNGKVVADAVTVHGRVIGTIRGRRVALTAGCHVEGTILHDGLSIETGAHFEGNCRHSADPLDDPTNG